MCIMCIDIYNYNYINYICDIYTFLKPPGKQCNDPGCSAPIHNLKPSCFPLEDDLLLNIFSNHTPKGIQVGINMYITCIK